MASPQATMRLKRELAALQKTPPPGIFTRPDPADILLWHFVIDGPVGTPYEGGKYLGRIRFPREYPFAPPSILMTTPSGRFEIDTRICLSMSDFHPKEWNPLWNTEKILLGLVSFMAEEDIATGTVKATPQERQALAANSHAFNKNLGAYKKLFPQQAGPC